jgi:transcriptional regulator with XRE-family HTH domain
MKSSKLHVSRRRRVFARFLGKIQHAILQALAEEHEKRGLTRAEIARILDTDKGFITKKLNGSSNMTVETMADFAYAMDRDIHISFPPRVAAAGSNQGGLTVVAGTNRGRKVEGGAEEVACAA